PKSFSKALSTYRKNKERKYFRKRAGIEPVIGHLKEDHRLSRNYYKGITGDEINVMLAAAGFNFKRMMNKWKSSFWLFLEKIIVFLNRQLRPIRDSIILQTI
ncbi:transposase, IS5 family, partial [Porphyromonadaceae bacterium NLAE-zl-C104]